MSQDEIIRNPTLMLRMGITSHEDMAAFELGRLAMGLEIETTARLLEGVIGDSLMHSSKHEVVSVLRTLLRDQELDAVVTDIYESMIEDRKLKFIAEGNGFSADASSAASAQRDDSSPPDGTDEWSPPLSGSCP